MLRSVQQATSPLASHGAPRWGFFQTYYLGTIPFVLLDVLADVNVRVAAFIDQPALRAAYYALCLACLAFTFWKPALSTLVGLGESALNIALLVLGIMLPLYTFDVDASGELSLAGPPVTLEMVANFGIAGSVCLLSFYRIVGTTGGRRFA